MHQADTRPDVVEDGVPFTNPRLDDVVDGAVGEVPAEFRLMLGALGVEENKETVEGCGFPDQRNGRIHAIEEDGGCLSISCRVGRDGPDQPTSRGTSRPPGPSQHISPF